MGESTILSLMPCFSFKTKKSKKKKGPFGTWGLSVTFSFLGLSALSSSCCTIRLQMSILTEMFCVRVLSAPVKCFARGSYPLQSNVLRKRPIPSSQNVLCKGPIPYISFKRRRGGRTSYIRIQWIVKLWTLKVNWKLGVGSAQWQAKRLSIPSMTID